MSLALGLALPAVASIVALATADARIDLRLESRTSTLFAEGFAPQRREALLARPGALLQLDATPVRLAASYAARIWTSDVGAQPSPFVTQEGRLRLETRHAAPWTAGIAVAAARGRTDPLADPVQALPQHGLSQTTLAPVQYEAVGATADGTFPIGRRTTIAADATAYRSGGIGLIARSTMPLQGTAAAGLVATHLLSLRNTLRVSARASASRTEPASGTIDSAWASGTAELRRRLAPPAEGWASAGAALTVEDAPDAPTARHVLPVGELGIGWGRDRGGVRAWIAAVPFTDRFTGDVAVMGQATGALAWRLSPRLGFDAVASAGALPSGDTALASLDARGRYALRERLALEAGVVGRWQRERAGTAPTFAELGVVVALAWESGPVRR